MIARIEPRAAGMEMCFLWEVEEEGGAEGKEAVAEARGGAAVEVGETEGEAGEARAEEGDAESRRLVVVLLRTEVFGRPRCAAVVREVVLGD